MINFQNDFFFFHSELIRNQTLKFLSKTLPILKADDTLPKVTQVVDKNFNDFSDGPIQRTFEDDEGGLDLTNEDEKNVEIETENPTIEINSNEEKEDKASRKKRSVQRKSRGFCDGGGVFCALYRAINGEPLNSHLIAERREESGPVQPRYEGPPTPCPAKVEYGKKQ